uniref:B30.2/SPRY domain-containing protein n=1 Tax=Cyprinodon variegatus TaxID=28743 RepID=A0A3Q2C6E8_CYPVA
MDSSSIKMPALGRPFSLGMLYDARKDELITGFSMWKEQFLEKKTKSEHNHSSSFQVLSSDSLQEKSSLCDLGTSLKASFLSGLIEVGGSAKYLNDKKKFKNQSRVILHYRAISYLSKLLMTPSEAQSEGELTDKVKSMATHVVTGIQYGANAFFVFDSEKAEEKPFQATLKAAIDKTLIADGNTSSSLKEEESFLNSISCKFYGDFLFENNPTTFEEALKTYQSLSKKLLEDTKNSVPVQVFLTPLKSYDPTAAAVTGEICEGLITKAQNVFEDLSQIEMRCNDILDMTALKNFSSYYNIFQKFSDLCKMFEKNLRDFLKETFPSIRAGKVCNSSVEKELDLKKTPLDNLERWISDKEAEVTAMNICLKSMEGIKIVPNESQLKTETFAQGVVHALCFTFTSLEDEDPYIDQMESSLHSQSFKIVYKPKQDQWYHSNAIIQQLCRKAEDLQNMAKGLKANTNDYLILSDENKKATCTSWQYYDSHPERFDKPQVLCNEGLCKERQHYYWEIEWSEEPHIGVGVAVESIERQGVLLGDNKKSWYFGQNQNGLVAKHNGQVWSNSTPPGGVKKIGVYLDFGGGTLSFYKVSCDKLEHLYTFKTSFNDHVYPGFYIYPAEALGKPNLLICPGEPTRRSLRG